jgi:hypothetical protein
LIEGTRRLMGEGAQAVGGGIVKGGGAAMGAGGTGSQGLHPGLIEGMDGVTDGLVIAAEGVGDPRDALLSRGGEEDLAATQREGMGGAQPGDQCVAFADRDGTDKNR